MWKVSILVVAFWGFHLNRCQFLQCHDDPTYTPDEGMLEDIQFTWLGALQYIHIKNGTPHYFRVPRVVLITRQFVLSTAKDASEIPEGYALGNIAFSEYERDETECELTDELVADGVTCESAAVLMPISDLLLHPEYNSFKVDHSIAVMKLLTQIVSRYMVPVCLPLKNYLVTGSGKIRNQIYLIDFTNDVPRDIMEEDKEITKLSLLPKELCYLYDGENTTVPNDDPIICTTGCGFHMGAASIIHEHTGHWTIIALSLGGSLCPDPLRSSRPPHPPRHILIHPYVPWIKSAIVEKPISAFSKDDPFGFVPRASLPDELFGHNWNGHWWMGGVACYTRGDAAEKIFKFYHEVFMVRPAEDNIQLTYYLELVAAYGSNVVCIKVGLPYQLTKPKAWGLETSKTKVRIPVLNIKSMYRFQVEAFAVNFTDKSESSSAVEDESDGA